MKRPLCVIGLTFALAVRAAFLLLENGVAQRNLLLFSLALALSGVLLSLVRAHRLWAVSLALLCTAAGIANGWLYVYREIAPFQAVHGQTIQVEGLVEAASYYPGSVRYTVTARFPERGDLPGKKKIWLRSYGEMELAPGDTVRCDVKLQASPENFAHHLRAGVNASCYSVGELERISPEGYRVRREVIRLHGRMQANLEDTLSREGAAMASGMALGQSGAVPDDIYRALVRSGSNHLLAVSGLHLSILAGCLLRVAKAMGLPRGGGTVATLVLCLGFALLTGMSPSVMRAFFMLCLVHVAVLLQRKNDSVNSLGSALLLMVMLCPQWTVGNGIWLSSSATLGILVLGGRLGERMCTLYRPVSPRVDRLARGILICLGISLGAYVFTLPLLVLFYGSFSLVAPLTNVAIAPFAAPALLGSMACAAVGGTPFIRPVVLLADFSLRMIVEISRALAALPFASVSLDRLWLLGWLLASTGAVCVLASSPKGRRWLACAAAACVLALGIGQGGSSWVSGRRIEVIALQGCGPAVVLRGRQAVLLGAPNQYEISTLLQYLRYRGVVEIAAVIAPDSTARLNSGLLRLCDDIPVRCVVGPDDPFVVEQLALALPEIPVYAGGHARITALGGALILADSTGEEIRMSLPGTSVVKLFEEYAIIEEKPLGGIVISKEGEAHSVKSAAWEPMGRRLYGETRFYVWL